MTIMPGFGRDTTHSFIKADGFAKPHVKLLDGFADRLATGKKQKVALGKTSSVNPIEWIDENFYVDTPRDTITAEVYAPGPIQMAPYQKRVIAEALSKDADGRYRYSTIVWSEPKKSGKTTIASAVALYMAEHNSAANIYCLANDGKQSQDRIFKSMAKCVDLHNKLGGCFKGLRVLWSPPSFKLGNGTHVEAIPCDAAGEAGSEPLMTVWSELWGFRQEHKERLWTELTIPPTLYGRALRWVESYAGYEDESTVLWNLYDAGVNNGKRHPAFPDLPVYVNEAANQLTFWSHEPRMPWQTEQYYAAEATLLLPNEFNRIHRNYWTTSTSSFLDDIITWDKCRNSQAGLDNLGDDTPMVVALDASISGDCCAFIAVSRHPDDDWDSKVRRVLVRYVKAFTPPKGGKMDYSTTFDPLIRQFAEEHNVYKFVYDPYQLHKLATDMRKDDVGAFEEFDQGGRRAKADKQLRDMIIQRQIGHDGDPVLRSHIQACAAKAEGTALRLEKKNNSRPIDLAVALSMATDEVLRLNV